MSEKSSYFASRLKELREEAGLSQYALAQRSGLTKQALSRLEGGTRDPGWETVQRLSLALDVEYGAFADPAITLPGPPVRGAVGRPRKEPAVEVEQSAAVPGPVPSPPENRKRGRPKGSGKKPPAE